MFTFTLAALTKDIVVSLGCFAVLLGIFLGVLLAMYWRNDKGTPGAASYKEYAKAAFARPGWRYGYLALALVFAIFGSRLVVVKLLLALCYGGIMLRLFKPKDD